MWGNDDKKTIGLLREILEEQMLLRKKVDTLQIETEQVLALLKKLVPGPAVSFTATVTAN